MDRNIVYPASLPQDTDILNPQKNAMLALGFLAQATIGTSVAVDGLACTPTGPATMVVNIGPGSIISLQPVDATAFGSLAADTADTIMKMGINLGSTPFTLTAPGTSGQSINYLIEAEFTETDTNPVVLPYYNPGNPAVPYSGPSNSGATQNTQRIQRVGLQLKPGSAATTGTQTTPAVDSGWVGLYYITVNYGQTTVTSSSIFVYAGAPFIGNKTAQRPARGLQQWYAAGTYTFTVPSGVTVIEVECIGSGAGGGGANGTGATWAAGNGGAGTSGVATFSVTPGQIVTVVVGAGGTAGTSTASGGNGNATTITIGGTSYTISCPGGGGGTTQSGASGAAPGGSGGAAATQTGALSFSSLPGGFGSDGFPSLGGQGGASSKGGGGRASTTTNASVQNGAAPGSGGGAGYYAVTTGGRGADGYAAIRY